MSVQFSPSSITYQGTNYASIAILGPIYRSYIYHEPRGKNRSYSLPTHVNNIIETWPPGISSHNSLMSPFVLLVSKIGVREIQNGNHFKHAFFLVQQTTIHFQESQALPLPGIPKDR
jgi:hypothetical protein